MTTAVNKFFRILFGNPESQCKPSSVRLDVAFQRNLQAAKELKDAVRITTNNNVRPIRSNQGQHH